MLKTMFAALAIFAASAAAAWAGDITSSVDASALPKKKLTPAALYLSPQDAHAALEADPSIVFIDVRDPVEIAFVGHAASVDAIVPLAVATHEFDAKKGRYKMAPNKSFAAQAKAAIARLGGDAQTPVFVICRSGGRSAKAAKALIEAGYPNVWNLVEGFEGDKDKATGERTMNGWRNAGLPWTYKISADAAWTP